MLWKVPKVPLDQIYMTYDIANIKRCAYHLKRDNKINLIAEALTTYSSKKEFGKFFDEITRTFIVPDWLYSVRDFVDEKLHKLYPKHRFVKGEIEASAMALIVRQSRDLFSPISVMYPCLICFPSGVEAFEMCFYAQTTIGDLNEETEEKYKKFLYEGADMYALSFMLAEEILDSVFYKNYGTRFDENTIIYSPELKSRIHRDSLGIILSLNLVISREAKQ